MSLTEILAVNSQSCRPVLTFNLGNYQFAVVGTEDGSSLTDTGCADMFHNSIAGVGNLDNSKFFRSKEHDLLFVLFFEHRTEFFVLFYVNGAVLMSARQNALIGKGLVYLVINMHVVFRVMSQTEANRSHHRDEMQFEHPFRGIADER